MHAISRNLPLALLAVAGSLLFSSVLIAQESEGPVVRDSSVGYIDCAIPGNVLRLRYDDAYNNRFPARAEFFYARSGAAGPGPPLLERSVDYQDATLYGETLILPNVSAFIESPYRWLNPDLNNNVDGFGDLNAGLKYAFLDCPDEVLTFQFRTFAPTGSARVGIGTHHTTLEPALLYYRTLTEQLRFEGELRYWTPIGGTEFAGDVVRYGAGLQYLIPLDECWTFAPVAEVVGWTVIGGQRNAAQDASGDTIVNVKIGARTKFSDRGDVYVGYGRPLTGDAWYENILRAELRLFF
jgi:hypothetical protein